MLHCFILSLGKDGCVRPSVVFIPYCCCIVVSLGIDVLSDMIRCQYFGLVDPQFSVGKRMAAFLSMWVSSGLWIVGST